MNSSINITTKLKSRVETNYIVLHHSATTRKSKCDVFDIHRWHIEKGWSGIGYHFVIEKDGTLRSGRPLNSVGAHCKDHNSDSIGICMVGGLDDNGKVVDNFDESQYKTLQTLVVMLQEVYPSATFVKHKDLAPTECNEANIDKIKEHIR